MKKKILDIQIGTQFLWIVKQYRDLGDKLGFQNSRAFMDKLLDAGTEVPA